MTTDHPKTYLVSGFMDAGKTTFIQNLIFRDYFHKRENGKTLILVFDFGETDYDLQKLASFRTNVELWEGGDYAAFLLDAVRKHQPDRIFVEANCMLDGLSAVLQDTLNLVSTTLLIDAQTLDLYYLNLLQYLQDMVQKADPIIFNRASEKEDLQPYATAFRLMNQKAGFLWESPMGYHEKVFGNALPFDRMQPHITLTEEDYPHWYLDALEYPEHYAGKEIELEVQLQYEASADNPQTQPTGKDAKVIAGRTVMTCCMNDIQFLGFPVKSSQALPKNKSFLHLTAKAGSALDPVYKKQRLYLEVLQYQSIPTPSSLILSVRKNRPS